MKTLKNTVKYVFVKQMVIAGKRFDAIIEVEQGTDKRGDFYASVNQVNTANVAVDNAADLFEDGKISTESMFEVLNSEGYYLNK